ncbi:hypothetical protein [Salegentibacter chungangensis]|uniref:Calx-beta domain-containing protein n=1 Tax=Salegentibacter chungangensis TaxID=1335724 RepID=A0ABW3NPE2_9FLAO
MEHLRQLLNLFYPVKSDISEKKMMNYRRIILPVLLLVILPLFIGCGEDDSLEDVGETKVSFSDETYRVAESSEEGIRIPVGLDSPYHTGGSVQVNIEGGVFGEDYVVDKQSSTFNITFAETSVLEFFTITPIDDDRLNTDVELEITLSNPTGSLMLGDKSFLQVILLDDEERLTAEVGFDPLEYEVEENEELEVDLAFSNLSTDGGSITIVGGSGDAVYGEDYTFEGANEDGELTLSVDEYGDAAAFTVISLDNDDYEDDKTFQIQILETTGGLNINSENSIATVTILEDDPSPFTTIGFDASSTSSADESAGEVTIDFSLSQPLENAASIAVNVGSSSTATLGDDFAFAGGATDQPYMVNLDAGAESGSISLMLTDDDAEEGDETIVLDIASVTGDLEIDSNSSSFTFNIQDNEGGGSGTSDVYLETFENSSADATIQDPYGFVTEVLSATTVANPESSTFSLNNASGKFADADDVSASSDWGAQIGYVNKDDGETSTGIIDNVLISPAISSATASAYELIYDIAYAKPNSTAVVEVYYSTDSDGTSFSNGTWTMVDSVDESNIGTDRNAFARRTVNIPVSGEFYIAFRIKATIDSTGSDNEGTRWRIDNIRVNQN